MGTRFACTLFSLAFAMSPAVLADDWNKKFAVSGQASLRVGTDDGSVVVRGGGAGEIEARVTTEGWRISNDEVRITEHQTGGLVELDVRLPKTHWGWNGRRSVRIEVRVPADTRTDIRTGDGSVTVEGLKGESRLHTGDGGIRVYSFDGSLAAHTGDGRISFRGRFDSLSLDTGDGSIEGEVLSGSRLAAGWKVQTGDGSVRLRIPGDLAADLDVHTGDGSIRSDLTVTVSGTLGKSTLRGKLNGGGATFLVRTHDGSIHLEKL